MTREPRQTLEGSAAGEASCSPHLQALPSSPPSRTRGLARHSQVGDTDRTGELGEVGKPGKKAGGLLGEALRD